MDQDWFKKYINKCEKHWFSFICSWKGSSSKGEVEKVWVREHQRSELPEKSEIVGPHSHGKGLAFDWKKDISFKREKKKCKSMWVYRFNWSEDEGQEGNETNCQLCSENTKFTWWSLDLMPKFWSLSKFCKLLPKNPKTEKPPKKPK